MNQKYNKEGLKREDFNLQYQCENLQGYYRFFDKMIQEQCHTDRIKIRQVVTGDDFLALSDARLRMYSQRDQYFKTLYPSGIGLDEGDMRSYIFVCYYDDQIIASQRIMPFPYELSDLVDFEVLEDLLGDNFVQSYVEFSRLVVDKHCKVKGIANAMSKVSGTLVALFSGYRNYVTYTKVKRRKKASSSGQLSQARLMVPGKNGFSMSKTHRGVKFVIPERDDNEYTIYQGQMLASMSQVYSLGECSDEDSLALLHKKVADEVVSV